MNLDVRAVLDFLSDGVSHYERSAPTVADYLNDLFIRCGEAPESVKLVEILRVRNLKDEVGWKQPNYAANMVFKLMATLGMDTTGHAGF